MLVPLGDTAKFRNRLYHQATDTPDTRDYTFLRRNTQAVLATVLYWAGSLANPRAARGFA